MVFVSPPHLPRSPDDLRTEASLISTTCTNEHLRTRTDRFSVSLVATQQNALVAQLSPRPLGAVAQRTRPPPPRVAVQGDRAATVTRFLSDSPVPAAAHSPQVCADRQKDQKKSPPMRKPALSSQTHETCETPLLRKINYSR